MDESNYFLILRTMLQWAENMAGETGGVSKQIMQRENEYCYGNSLNLAASGAVKKCKIMADALDITFEISKLIKHSPKRNTMLNKFNHHKKIYIYTCSVDGVNLLCI